ncbi:4 -phosphopantetheinyl transferase : Phosphopantetheinyl transferase OS=Oscillatoria acuminata PCC 6304 GN=Oscil6304_3459 PE=4 SV=1: ACPS [Gemmataceae bacterium]|nr:4 -phosphopantetheinyl transferase : Phosphopantetheinyl transferase OS=Oscillatoria acuminata PCC 6304 GN=Oscil6304_3459 PE=4 SV=1: ACPS [Gemmataceae bacterium]VTT98653.1 4 -phosphopantetheinyl transferase : Phosphopantetheinyl transferase OS=Oscillatoria acuminata PCC 6304 GN=Oscil6304_3459 PE=4 SV=1: ACPS [Gemmataceae bacterium]
MPSAPVPGPRVVHVPLTDLGGRPGVEEVRVWVVKLEYPPANEASLLACLTAEEHDRAARYKVARPRHQFVTGRGLIRQILGACLGVRPAEVPITYTGAGKPVLDGGELHFNVTHTDAVALLALATRPVGIDTEQVRDLANPDGLVQRFFSPAEREAYRNLPPQLKRAGFFHGWTCKEAVIKAAGLSVTCLESFDVELDPARPPAVIAARHAELADRRWGLAAWEPVPGFAAAVALGE